MMFWMKRIFYRHTLGEMIADIIVFGGSVSVMILMTCILISGLTD